MAKFVWKTKYHIGDQTIDEQHAYLFDLANSIVNSKDKPSLVNNMMKLYRYVREHFSHEEQLMKQLHYGEYNEHVAMHNTLIDQLSAVSDSIGQDCWQEEELKTFMNEWLLGHILKVDSQLGAFIRSRRAAD
ncbi:MAG: bacteriohemerythrin [Methylococcaceae bacterium]|nr:MAG: bacteriohemerythrin [Methylococcaceae bacterium]